MRTAHDVLGELARSYLFEGLSTADLRPLPDTATTRSLIRSEYAGRLGDPADDLSVVFCGELQASVAGADGNQLIHHVHGPGMTFGEPGYFSIGADPHRGT